MGEYFSVCLTTHPLPPLHQIAGPLAKFRNLLIPDVFPIIKPCWGLIEENLMRAPAQQLSQLLNEARLSHVVVPTDRVEPHREAHLLGAVSLEEQGLKISADKKIWQLIPWSAFSLLAVGVFREKIIHKTTNVQGPSVQEKLIKTGLLLATGLPLPMTRKKTVVTTTEETSLHYCLDFFLKAPELRLRVDGNKLDYQFLKDKLVVGSQENFRIFLKELVKWIPGVTRNESYHRMTKSPAQALDYHESEKSFDQECRWLLTILKNT